MASDEQSRGESAAFVLAYALIYATLVLAMRLVEGDGDVASHLQGAYRLGVVLGFPGNLVVGCVLGLPLYGAPRSTGRRIAVTLLGTGMLLLHATMQMGEGGGAAMAGWCAAYVVVTALGLRPLGDRLTRREATRAGRIADAASIAALAALTLATLVAGGGPTWRGAVGPLARLAGFTDPALDVLPTPPPLDEGAPEPAAGVPPDVMEKVQGLLGVEAPTPIVDPRYPFCRDEPPSSGPTRPRSVLLLLLDDVGSRELAFETEAGPLMPELARIAADGVRFERFLAPSEDATDAVVAAMSGLPPSTRPSLAHAIPMPRVDGVAGDLAAHGYRTAFAYGTTPSIDHLRPFLRAVGFETVLEPPADGPAPTGGWGQPDGRTLTRLREWVGALRVEDDPPPYLAVFRALSTRPPESLPDGAGAETEDAWSRHVEAVRYLDGELGHFYAWYREHEAPRGTLLLIAGARAAPLAAPGDPPPSASGAYEPRFAVPLVVAGLSGEERARARGLVGRPGSHVDLPQTLLGLVGMSRRGCYQGRDLLDTEAAEWPLDRLVVSIGGRRREHLYVRHGPHRWMFTGGDAPPTLYDVEGDPTLRRDLYAADDPDLAVLQEFVDAYRALDNYLRREDAYRPPTAPPTFTPVAPREQSLPVSDGGYFDGVEGRPSLPPNSVPAIEQALQAGFPWIEAEVQVTKDGVPIVAPRNVLELNRLNLPAALARYAGRAALPYAEVTRAQVQQLRLPFDSLAEQLARAGGRAGLVLTIDAARWSPERVRQLGAFLSVLAARPAGSEVMVRSTDVGVLATVSALGDVPTAFSTGGRAVDARLLDFLAEQGVDVVDLSTPILSEGLLEDAHRRGLRVMAPAATASRGDLVPDFVIGPNLGPPPPR